MLKIHTKQQKDSLRVALERAHDYPIELSTMNLDDEIRVAHGTVLRRIDKKGNSNQEG